MRDLTDLRGCYYALFLESTARLGSTQADALDALPVRRWYKGGTRACKGGMGCGPKMGGTKVAQEWHSYKGSTTVGQVVRGW